MSLLMIKYGNMTLTTTITLLTVSFMFPIPSKSGRLLSEFVRLLFLQNHRETDRFFTTSGVQLP